MRKATLGPVSLMRSVDAGVGAGARLLFVRGGQAGRLCDSLLAGPTSVEAEAVPGGGSLLRWTEPKAGLPTARLLSETARGRV